MSKTVSKKMLINVVHPEEARVAIVHDGRLMELNIEITGKEQLKGNIYKGVVVRVEPSLQAAFVDIGRAKPGFLQMGELHPDFWQWRDDVPEDQRKRRPRIQEVLRRGQELMVQVEKDERDHKGSALTSYVSLPGRYMVLMPGSDSKGISRKVEQEGERKKLKEIVAGMNIPEGIGYIIRTEAVGRTAEEITKDFENLLELYQEIKRRTTEINGAGEVYQDKGLICRFIRDYFSDAIDEVLVDSKEAYRDAKEYFREVMPDCEKLVKLHKEKRPIFSRFQLEEQIDQIYEKRVTLPSGGYLIIEPTEALVSIDVNSGKSSGERGIEETAFKTNLEAVEEAARQLRLRDLGGLIVIDCIDMRENRHNIEVEKTLKQALKMDKARVNVGRISEFGMLEMSRQRIAKTLNDAIHLECPHCEGRGKVKSVEAMAVSFLRKVHAAAAKGTVGEVHGGLPLEVAYYLLNRKKRELTQIENDYEIEVTVKGKTSFLLNQLELEIVKREKPRAEDEVLVAAEQKMIMATAPVDAEVTEGGIPVVAEAITSDAEGGKKKKRRRKKKKHPLTGEGELAETDTLSDENQSPDAAEESEDESSVADQTDQPLTADDAAGTEGAAKKKRKRRRKKPARRSDETTEGTTVEVVETVDSVEIAAVQPQSAQAAAETVTGVVAEATTEGEPDSTAAAAHKKRKRPPRKRKRSEAGAADEAPLEPEISVAAVTAEVVPAVVELTAEEFVPAVVVPVRKGRKPAKVVQVDELAKPAKPKPAPKKKTAKQTEDLPVEAVAEPVAMTVTTEALPLELPAAKPVKKAAPRRRTAKVQDEQPAQVAVSDVVPTAAVVEGETAVEAKPKSRGRKKKVETVSEG